VGCRELRAKRYISDGFCTSTKPINEVVCAGNCLPIRDLPWYAEFVRVWAAPKIREWQCEEDVVKRKSVHLLCRNGNYRTYRIKVVKSCRCSKVDGDNSTDRRKDRSKGKGQGRKRGKGRKRRRKDRKRQQQSAHETRGEDGPRQVFEKGVLEEEEEEEKGQGGVDRGQKEVAENRRRQEADVVVDEVLDLGSQEGAGEDRKKKRRRKKGRGRPGRRRNRNKDRTSQDSSASTPSPTGRDASSGHRDQVLKSPTR
jgi:hypothetical protein